jgi:hypothetical protein
LPKMAQPVAADARLSAINGVLPMAPTIPSLICIAAWPGSRKGGRT